MYVFPVSLWLKSYRHDLITFSTWTWWNRSLILDNIFLFFIVLCKICQCRISNFNVRFVDGIRANKSVGILFNTIFTNEIQEKRHETNPMNSINVQSTAHRRTSHMAAHHVEIISNGNTWQHAKIPMSLILKNQAKTHKQTHDRVNAQANESNLNISLAYDKFANCFDSFDLWSIGTLFKWDSLHWLASGSVPVSVGDSINF